MGIFKNKKEFHVGGDCGRRNLLNRFLGLCPNCESGDPPLWMRLVKHVLAGGIIGILVLHPLSMIAHNFFHLDVTQITKVLEKSFSYEHIAMAVYFILIGMVFGLVHGIYAHVNSILYSEIRRMATRLSIYFPKSRVENDERFRSAEDSAPEGEEAILVVEDEAQILDLAELFLKEAGYKVLKAHDPNEAIDIAMQHQGIDLLLSDVIMPEMNGKALQMQIERFQPEIRTVFMSGYTDDVTIEKTLGVNESDLISKPFTVRTLTHKVREILDR